MSKEIKLTENEVKEVSGGGLEPLEIYPDSNHPMITCERYNRGACPYDFSTYQDCVTVQKVPGCYCRWRRR